MSLLASLAKHTRNYSFASVLTTVAGLISFPILTRALQVEDYGVMSLIASALTLAVGLGKLGMQHATLRFYGEARAGSLAGVQIGQFAPTVLYGMAALGAVATLLWLLITQLLPAATWDDARMPALMLFTAVLVLVRVLDSAVANLLRAQERSGLLALLTVIKRYIGLALVVGAVLLISPTLWSFYGATVLGEVLLLLGILWWVLRSDVPRVNQVSPPLLRAMVVFAIPMTGYELASVVLQMGDRYVQQAVLGAEAVGLYSASYNLCDYIKLALFSAMSAAALPMCMRLGSEQSDAVVEQFLDFYTHIYFLAALLVVAITAAVRVELLAVLASPKYQAGAAVIPLVITGMMFEAYIVIAGVGLYLRKRSVTTMILVAAGAVLNIVLNLLLVPRLGILGSAVANVVSYLAIVVAALQATRATLKPPPFLRPLLKFGAIALGAYLAATRLELGHPALTLVGRGAAVCFVYVGLALLLDARAREITHLGWDRLKARRAA
ncbi:MAG: oligosaccharide flippase family protein [Burkholderiales bacterium]